VTACVTGGRLGAGAGSARVPAALIGRVSSLYGTFTRGAEALGAIAGRVLAAAAGIRARCWLVPRRCLP
jgi:hypothetical protein